MEYRKRCNVCGHVFCYTDEDIKKNNTNTLLSGLSALGTIAGVASGNMMAARINQADRINSEGKIIDFTHCPNCNSQDILDVSDTEWEKYNKQIRNERPTIQINSNAPVESLIKRIYLFLEDGDFSSADAYCEQVLDLEPENGELYLLKQLVEFELHSVDEIVEKCMDLSSGTYYARIKKYGSDDLIKQVTQIEKTVRINQYDSLVKRMDSETNSLEQLREIANKLSQYSDVEGALEKKQECYDKITAIEEAEKRRREENDKNRQITELEHTIESGTEISEIKRAQTELIELLGEEEKNRIDAQCDARISEIGKQEKDKQKKTLIGVAVLLAIFLILIGVHTGKSISDKNKTENLYQEAVTNLRNENYVPAINAFAELGDYKDSSTLKSDAYKSYALKLFQEKDYAQAKQMFLRVKDDSEIEQYIEYCRLYEKFQEIGEGTDLTELYASTIVLGDFNNANELVEQNKYFQDLNKIVGKWCAVDESFSDGNLFEITKEYSFIDLLWENHGRTPEYHITIKDGHIAACTKQYLYPYGEVYKYLEVIDETSVKYNIGGQNWEQCKRR